MSAPKEILIGKKKFLDFEIGSDPEFRIKGMRASQYVPNLGKFGTDGPNSQVAELRPDPCFCPLNHALKVQEAFRQGWQKYAPIRTADWLAGSYPEGKPLGGHIHFNSSYKENMDIKLDTLDKFLAPVILMLEDTGDAQKRRGTEYGQLGTENRGFSQQPYGGFEYRSPASWLVSKMITSGTLCLAKALMFEVHNKTLMEKFTKLLKFIKKDEKFKSAYRTCDKRFFAPVIPTIYRVVRNLRYIKYHKEYMPYINHLFQLISQGRTWNDKMDLKKRWNIIPNVRQTEKIGSKTPFYTLGEIWQDGLNPNFGAHDREDEGTHQYFLA